MRSTLSVLILLLIAASLPAVAQDLPDTRPRLIIDEDRLAELYDLTHPCVGFYETNPLKGAEPPPPDGINQNCWQHPEWMGTLTERQTITILAYRSVIESADAYVRHGTGGFWSSQGHKFKGLMTLALAHNLRKNDEALDYPDYGPVGYGGVTYDDYVDFIEATVDNWSLESPHHDDDDPNVIPDLSYAEMLGGLAIVYDWLHDDLININVVKSRMIELLNSGGYSPEESDYAGHYDDNNHVAMIFGARGLAALALSGDIVPSDGLIETPEAILAEACGRMRDYLDAAFEDEGSGTEGLMYANYGMTISLPLALTVDRLGLGGAYEIDVAGSRHVQQAGTWLIYETLPYDVTIGTLHNDTGEGIEGLNHINLVGWPWLLGFPNPARPSAALHLLNVTYPPNLRQRAFDEFPFIVNSDSNLYGSFPFSLDLADPDPNNQPSSYTHLIRYNPAAILLGIPELDADIPEWSDADSLRPSRSFEGHGMTFMRSELPSIVGGDLSHDPDGWMATYLCRNKTEWDDTPTWPGQHYGHAQYDVNHFMLYAYGVPIFYDSGYPDGSECPRNESEGHNVCEIWDGASWVSHDVAYIKQGVSFPSLLPAGNAPMMAGGSNEWSLPISAERADRRLFVMPRAEGHAPYLLVHDDYDATGSTTTKFRWLWQSDNSLDQGNFTLDEGPSQVPAATLVSEIHSTNEPAAVTKASFLSPADVDLIQDEFDDLHWRLQAETLPRDASDFVVLIDTSPIVPTLPELESVVLTASGSGNPQGWRIDDGDRTDIVAVRRADTTSEMIVDVGGRELRTDARHAVLRFSGPELEWSQIDAGLLSEGTYVYYDDHLVMGAKASFGVDVSMSFSSEETWIRTLGLGLVETYFVGPVIPATLMVDRQDDLATTMAPVPHPVATDLNPDTGQAGLGRSPVNDMVRGASKFELVLDLRTGEDAPVVDWPMSSIKLAYDPSILNPAPYLPEDDSDPDGRIEWVDGLIVGGGGTVVNGAAAWIEVDYSTYGWGRSRLFAWPDVMSPDINGDGQVNVTDFAMFSSVYGSGSPLYMGDFNFDGDVTIADFSIFSAHYNKPGKK